MWDMWIDGFERAMRLRPDAWKAIALSDDGAAAASVCTILTLSDIFYSRSMLTEEAEDEFDWLAPELTPEFVVSLDAWTKSWEMDKRAASAAGLPSGVHRAGPPAFGRAVESDALCPCGSGRTYMRCCGAH